MTNKIKIVYKEVGKRPKTMFIDDTLEAKQELVDGVIEVLPYKEDMLIICNEEFKILGLPKNILIHNNMFGGDKDVLNDYIGGNFFVVGDDYENEGFKSLTPNQVIEIKKDLNSKTILYPEIDYLDNQDEMEAD